MTHQQRVRLSELLWVAHDRGLVDFSKSLLLLSGAKVHRLRSCRKRAFWAHAI